jgi:hypothetical protein
MILIIFAIVLAIVINEDDQTVNEYMFISLRKIGQSIKELITPSV